MATTTIPWGDGSGDNIYLTYPSASGNQTVEVSSDANTGAARSQVVTFTSGVGNITKQLTVNQEAGVVEHTLQVLLSSYDSVDKSYYNITGTSYINKDPSSNTSTSTCCAVVMKRGESAETWCYFKFDTSQLPANAQIVSVACRVRTGISTTSSTYVVSKGCVMCSGTTVKTSSVTVHNDGYLRSFDTGTWTREELSDVRIKLYGTRGTTNVNSNYSLRMYGAELTITYTV